MKILLEWKRLKITRNSLSLSRLQSSSFFIPAAFLPTHGWHFFPVFLPCSPLCNSRVRKALRAFPNGIVTSMTARAEICQFAEQKGTKPLRMAWSVSFSRHTAAIQCVHERVRTHMHEFMRAGRAESRYFPAKLYVFVYNYIRLYFLLKRASWFFFFFLIKRAQSRDNVRLSQRQSPYE